MSNLFYALNTSPKAKHPWRDPFKSALVYAENTRQSYCDLFDFAPIGYLVTDMAGCIQGANQAAGMLFGMPAAHLTQKSLIQFVNQAEQAWFCAQLASLPQAQGSQDWELRLQPESNHLCPVNLSVTVVRNGQGEALGLRWLIWARAQHPPGEATSGQTIELTRANTFLRALNHAATCIKTTRDPEQVLKALHTELNLLRLKCFVALRESPTQAWVIRQISATPETLLTIEHLLGKPVLGLPIPVEHFSFFPEVAEHRRPLYFAEPMAALAPLLAGQPPSVCATLSRVLGLTPHTRVVYLPLGTEEQVLGMVVLWGERLCEADISALAIFTSQVATILDNARLLQELETQRTQLRTLSQQLVQAIEAERGRIARELHDEAGQLLYSLRLRLDALAHTLPTHPHFACLAQIETMRELVEKARCKIRNLSHELRPAPLEELGLILALRWLVSDFGNEAGLLVAFETDEMATRLPPPIEAACYRIVQEAFTNIVRHAQAQQVRVHLKAEGNYMYLYVEDDGCGFDPRQMRAKGIGLLGIQERALSLNGQVVICSAPGQGTRLEVQFPLHLPEIKDEANAYIACR